MNKRFSGIPSRKCQRTTKDKEEKTIVSGFYFYIIHSDCKRTNEKKANYCSNNVLGYRNTHKQKKSLLLNPIKLQCTTKYEDKYKRRTDADTHTHRYTH